MGYLLAKPLVPVSYTHLDVYKRQLADRVLILPAPAEEKTIGGIIIPDTAKEKPLQGDVYKRQEKEVRRLSAGFCS